MKPIVAVIGSGDATPSMEAVAEALGRGIVALGARLVTGGRGGVMAAASRGARGAPEWSDGDVIGILPGYGRDGGNRDLDIALPTGLGHARNVLVVSMADVVVAVGGEAGTVSEIGLACKLGRPVVVVASAGGAAPTLVGALPFELVEGVDAALGAVERRLATAGP